MKKTGHEKSHDTVPLSRFFVLSYNFSTPWTLSDNLNSDLTLLIFPARAGYEPVTSCVKFQRAQDLVTKAVRKIFV
jgi:hypothetical protein